MILIEFRPKISMRAMAAGPSIDVSGWLEERLTQDSRGVDLVALGQQIDTSTPNGKLVFHIMAALAEWEAAMTRERTLEGLEAARQRHGGKLPVRGPSISAEKIKTAAMLAATTDMPAHRVAEVIGVSRATLYRHVNIGAIRAGRETVKRSAGSRAEICLDIVAIRGQRLPYR